MKYRPITLSDGTVIQPGPNGAPGMMFKDGRASTDILSRSQVREYEARFAQEHQVASMEQARSAASDPRYKDASDYIRATCSPEEVARIDSDPVLFNKYYGKARNLVGASDAEVAAEGRRQERMEGIAAKLLEDAGTPEGKITHLEDVAELMRLRGQGGE